MLAGKGFEKVYNVIGGFKKWKGEKAFGKEILGLDLFAGDESLEKTMVIAYSLENGLRDFYLAMIPATKNHDAKDLFRKLAEIELKHQDRIFAEYINISGKSPGREEFEDGPVKKAVEGGLTTQEYLDLFQPDPESGEDIIELAMSIEAQALDLYLRASDRSSSPDSKNMLIRIADEERMHLTWLGELMERLDLEGIR